MKDFFIDTNIVIDFLVEDREHSDYAGSLFNLADKGKINLYISALTYSHVYYVLRKHFTHKKLLNAMQEVEEMTTTLDVTRDIISKAMLADFKDYEDAIQYQTALSNRKINAIVTHNGKDFKNSDLAVLTALEALSVVEMGD